MEEREYLIALNALSGMSTNKKIQLINQLGSANKIFHNKDKVAALCPPPFFMKNLSSLNFENFIKQEEKKAKALNISISIQQDKEYPLLLKEIPDPPLAVYHKGTMPHDTRRSLAIVGSRNFSPYGKVVAEHLTKELVLNEFIITSGLARGIDSIAHRTTLKEQGITIAVLGSGLDVVYPPENRSLFNAITETGVVLSEFPLGTEPHKMNFPIRNRIISGLCPGILVIEAKEKSGALITANCALDQGREVFAIPGNIISPYSKGTNQLIRQGARLVEGVKDILEEFGLAGLVTEKKTRPAKYENLDHFESKVLSLLSADPIPIDIIIQRSGESPSYIHSTLLTLEIKGVIKQLPGKLFLKTLRI